MKSTLQTFLTLSMKSLQKGPEVQKANSMVYFFFFKPINVLYLPAELLEFNRLPTHAQVFLKHLLQGVFSKLTSPRPKAVVINPSEKREINCTELASVT